MTNSSQKIIHVNHNKSLPKYQQIIDSFERAVFEKKLIIGDKLPSVNKLCMEYNISRDTVLLAYDNLKRRGIIRAIPGKGYYVNSTQIQIQHKVFLLFDELNVFKEDLYNSLLSHLGSKAKVEIFFHHFNFEVFTTLVRDNVGKYTSYVIMPANFDNSSEVINHLPRMNVYILDQLKADLLEYPAVYQNFKKDMFDSLQLLVKLIKKYRKLILLITESKQPKEMLIGFESFCESHDIPYEILYQFSEYSSQSGNAYIVPGDRDLIKLIKNAKDNHFTIGKDIGIISYNDSLLKEVVHNGITTISTDFDEMGKQLANLILHRKNQQIANKCKLTLRKSL